MPDANDLVQMTLIGEALDQGPALIFVADDEMRYVAVNQAVADALGYSREELLQLKVTDLVRTPTAPEEYGEMLRRRGLSGEALLTAKDGGELRFAYRAAKTKVAGLEFFVSVGFVEDGT